MGISFLATFTVPVKYGVLPRLTVRIVFGRVKR
jgi:hypothetical protein